MSNLYARLLALDYYVAASIDVDVGSGATAAAIAAGYYFLLGSHGRVTTADTSATIRMSAGHRLQVDDPATVWDISADVALASAATVIARDATTVTLDTSTTHAVGDRVYDDRDLVGLVEAKGASIGAGAGDPLRVSVNWDTGVMAAALASGGPGSLGWAAATEIRDRWRYLGSATTLDTLGRVGSRVAHGGLYPVRATVDEADETELLRTIYGVDSGSRRIYSIATSRELGLDLLVDGIPRASIRSERDAASDWLGLAAQGVETRYYPDRDEDAAYDRDDAPTGFESWVVASPAGNAGLRPLTRDDRGHWLLAMRLAEHD